MSIIYDYIVCYTTLANSVQDRKIASEINQIQSLTLDLQSEQAQLHETNIKLREERIELVEKIQSLEAEIKDLKESGIKGPDGTPACPNCSTSVKPFYMAPIPPDFVFTQNATHECSQCGYKFKVED